MAARSPFDLFGPYRLVRVAIISHYEAFREALRKDGVAALIHLRQIHDVAMANMFIMASDNFIAHENNTVVPSLVRSAHGKILDLGPGPGNQLHRFDPSAVDFIYGVEPNLHFGDNIAAKVKKLDLQDKYKLLTCGIEDSEILRKEGVTEGSMDTVLSIQVLCSVNDLKSVMKELYKLLKPGGSFVFWEHEKNKDTVTAVAQECWNPAWSSLVGCSLTRKILPEILAAGEWENPDDIKVTNNPYEVLPRISGVLRKKA